MSDAVDSAPALGTKLSMTVKVLKRNLRCGPLVNHQHISENMPLAGDIISLSFKILSYRSQTLYIFEKTAFQNRVSWKKNHKSFFFFYWCYLSLSHLKLCTNNICMASKIQAGNNADCKLSEQAADGGKHDLSVLCMYSRWQSVHIMTIQASLSNQLL